MPSRPKEIILLPKQEILVLVITLFAASIDTQDYVQEPDTARKMPKLEDQIRRQLMKDNYDYWSSEEDALHTDRVEQDELHTDRAEQDALHTNRAKQDAPTKADGWEDGRGRDDNGPQLTTTTDDDNFNNMVPTMGYSSKHKDKNKEKPDFIRSIMSRKDLLYYIDDKRMRRAGYMSDNDVNNTSEGSDVEFDDNSDATKPDAKYKMIKVKEGEPTRRKAPYRRFIQESNREGYSIIRLDDQPFPAFRLPRARRQYMGGPDSADVPLLDHDSGAWKVAHIVPIHKTGDVADCSNYRPISIREAGQESCFAKVLESLVYDQLYHHLKPYLYEQCGDKSYVCIVPAASDTEA